MSDQNPRRSPIPDEPMRLIKVECTGNEVSAVGYVPESQDDVIIDWARSWDTEKNLFEGEVYVALNIPAPTDFQLEWGVFYFYIPPV